MDIIGLIVGLGLMFFGWSDLRDTYEDIKSKQIPFSWLIVFEIWHNASIIALSMFLGGFLLIAWVLIQFFS
jgi:uncharacterized membrane protein SpoIIM required for sporulation